MATAVAMDIATSIRTGAGPAIRTKQDRHRTGAGPAHGTKLLPRYRQAGRRRTGTGWGQDGGRTGAAAWGPCEVI